MNKVMLIGRLTRDPDVRYSQGEEPIAIARYTLAVDRRFHKDGEQAINDNYDRYFKLSFKYENYYSCVRTQKKLSFLSFLSFFP